MSRFLTASLRAKSTYNILKYMAPCPSAIRAVITRLTTQVAGKENAEREGGRGFHMAEREMFVHSTGLFIKLIYCGVAAGLVFGLWSAAILWMLRCCCSNGTTPGTCQRRRRHSTSICCYHFCVLPPCASVWAAKQKRERERYAGEYVCYICVICVIN